MRSVAFSLFFLLMCSCVFAHLSDAAAQIRLNEILADPGVDWDGDGNVSSKSDEWVEITNAGGVAFDLSCLRLGDTSGGFDWRFAFSGTLAPGEVIVVYGSEAVAWQSANGFPAFGLSLNNGGDTVYLYDVAGDDTITVDQYAYDSFEVLDDRSVGRSTDTPNDWVLFDGMNPYSGTTPPLGTGCSPSPDAVNACSPTVPVQAKTWGAIKEMFSH